MSEHNKPLQCPNCGSQRTVVEDQDYFLNELTLEMWCDTCDTPWKEIYQYDRKEEYEST